MKLVQIQNARTSAEPPPRSWKKIEETLVMLYKDLRVENWLD
ncbi:MAG TPA: hypothetical protein VFD27_00980 [Chthoniobacteraceae bacterium]|nr:hypothetical protein [Chthoniobacteraceae bacterium]